MEGKPHYKIQPDEGKEVCDFCTFPYVHAVYQCEDFVCYVIDGVEVASRGAWAACEICSGMVDREEWAALLERSVRKFVQKHGVPYEVIRPEIARNHMLFRQHRKMAA